MLRLFHDAEGLTLDVVDDGLGIPSDHPLGLGLQSMTERVAELGGTLTMQPGRHGRGTRVRAVLPCRSPQIALPADATTNPAVAHPVRRSP